MVKRFCTIGWALTGLIVAAMVVQHGRRARGQREAPSATPACTCSGPAWSGLMVACVLAANMSTCSNFMVNTGALFTRNLYQPYIRPQASDQGTALGRPRSRACC